MKTINTKASPVAWGAIVSVSLAVIVGAVGYGELRAQGSAQDDRLKQHEDRLKATEDATNRQTAVYERLDERSVNTQRAINQTLKAVEDLAKKVDALQ